MVSRQKIELVFFFALFAAVAALTASLFVPFFTVLALAAIFAVILQPLYRATLRLLRNKAGLASLATILMGLVFVAVPVTFIGGQVFNEAHDVYVGLQEDGGGSALITLVHAIEAPIQVYFPSFHIDVQAYGSAFFAWITSHLGPLLSGTATAFFGIILTIVALFFFLRDGKKFIEFFLALSPLDDKYDTEIVHRVGKTVNAVMRGALLISLTQGILAGIGLAIFGIPNAVLWGTVAAVSAVVPGVGAGLVVTPAVLYLLIQGHSLAALGLAAWGILIVGLVDNMLMPYLYGRAEAVHPLVMLFAVLGGLIAFGPIGFLIGPIIISLFIAVFDIYQTFTESPQKV
ncbi:MAG: hypothetical protein A2675_02010 [Candidatus Yonathbacteria bacterium RIFCSPHIGHO2_01_FULL_51_10]|uniref:AI-2E family transporter n=1 Tax=Candidatus Yonathbacteria bacterium RIFCSPHIGHO2_01_FULL_51_10 TaxID=1802723 RepID=A0A1G2SC05_9BACT|nr:MAG: hypothetical protein A2675_02010 [Candidatus Yonathbacteria bacterium RIFCSPHIGHO2_01_FULL_51_10]